MQIAKVAALAILVIALKVFAGTPWAVEHLGLASRILRF